jgi:hypothetical protein
VVASQAQGASREMMAALFRRSGYARVRKQWIRFAAHVADCGGIVFRATACRLAAMAAC